jgi:hypothetical protein
MSNCKICGLSNYVPHDCVASLKAELHYQNKRADGATLAMQEMQQELDELKPWAELGREVIKTISKCDDCSTSGICSGDVYDDDKICQGCEWELFCKLRKEM